MKIPMITIRPFNSQDTEGVSCLILPIQREEFSVLITFEEQPDLKNIPQFYQKENGNFWVAEMNGAIVGTVGLLDIGHEQAALRKMFVAEKYRGREHGVAKRLLDALVAWSVAKKLSQIYLGTTDKFLAAHRFYEKTDLKKFPNRSCHQRSQS